MRLRIVPVALLLSAGACAAPAHRVQTREPAPAPSAAPSRRPVDPAELALKLAGIQPGWPRRGYPLPPPKRKIDCGRVKCVALTYDDGPGHHTAKLLDILARYHARATFFLVGKMVLANADGALRRMVRDGHELGNHTWSHPQLTAMSEGAVRAELTRTQKVIERRTGVRATLMRPPYGATDKRVAAVARHMGLAQVLWSVDTLDWRDRVTPVVARRATAIKPGSIVLMHDIHRTTVEAAPRILKELTRRGFAFVTVSELYGRPLRPGVGYSERERDR
ncbi:polysaccharide deacetylase family protein [Streptosporangium sp. NPDC004379]|uniref:polysaccharide deacetylase family protein n=1 Tax=Streptosporangium sp. NPDC004379 TaxID=3366189 RepID=UPI003677BF18